MYDRLVFYVVVGCGRCLTFRRDCKSTGVDMLGEPRLCLPRSVDLRLTVVALVTLASLIGLNCYPCGFGLVFRKRVNCGLTCQ